MLFEYRTLYDRQRLPCWCFATSRPCAATCADRSAGPVSLNIRYTSMIDGTGKETGPSKTGEQDRLVHVDVAFVGHGSLILETKTGKAMKVGHLLFAREPDLEAELATLRVAGDKKKS